VHSHKAILVARGEYFRGVFRRGGMRESETGVVVMEKHNVPTVERMLEFVYTNRVECIKECSAHEVLDLLSAAEEFLLPELKKLCEHAAKTLINIENVAKMMSAAERFGAPTLRDACIQFVLSEHKNDVIDHPAFQQEFHSFPSLLIPIIKAAPSLSSSPPAKRQRIEAPLINQFEESAAT
jgi:hypothetical protein